MPYTAFTVALLAALLSAGSNISFHSSAREKYPGCFAISWALVEENKRIMQSAYSKGRYAEAHSSYVRLAREAEGRGANADAMAEWNNAGASSLLGLHFQSALYELSRSRNIALASRDYDNAARASNNIASLHQQMGNFEAALRIASEAISQRPGAKPDVLAKLRAQRAIALANLHRLAEARPVFGESISQLDDLGEWDAEVRARGMFGRHLVEAGALDEAEPVLVEALRLAHIHRIAAANVLRALALLSAARNHAVGAERLFASALAEPPGPTPQWMIYADRGEFRFDRRDFSAALSDFREARRLASEMRADIVPVDEDRVTLETGLGRIAAGIVNSENELAVATKKKEWLRQSFEIAEQDRQWSLRALMPAPDDWRSRLPAHYWDLLAQYQALERSLGNNPAGAAANRAGVMGLQLQMMEAAAGAGKDARTPDAAPASSALDRLQRLLPHDAVLFSFYTTKTKAWLWAVTQDRFNLYALPSRELLQRSVESFVAAVKAGGPESENRGRELYRALFGAVGEYYTQKPKWLLEPDGPLYSLPFPALVTSPPGRPPVWLVERAATELIPGALLLESGSNSVSGSFFGVADPVYNAADPRYRGRRSRVESSLARLPNTEAEVRNCSFAWGGDRSRIVTGMSASPEAMQDAIRSRPAILHFATHVIPGPGDFGSGVIALSLDRRGALGLLGPREILARPVTADLVVLDGCDSAQGATLPGAGLMGLTRAWIGAGAHAVLATLWDIPDESQSALPFFYEYLRAHPESGPAAALHSSQLEILARNKEEQPAAWAGYFLLARR